MPKVKQTVIELVDGQRIKEEPGTVLDMAEGILTVCAVETVTLESSKKAPRWSKEPQTETKQVKVPKMSYPLSRIKSIDWGWVSQADYDKAVEAFKKAQADNLAKQAKGVEGAK